VSDFAPAACGRLHPHTFDSCFKKLKSRNVIDENDKDERKKEKVKI
jgi:hypothetical protein